MLSSIWTGRYDQIMMWCSSEPQSDIAKVLCFVTYCYVILPCLTCYSSPHLSYHKRSFSHPGIAYLRPSISIYSMRSSYHPGISCVCPIIPTYQSAFLSSPCCAPPPLCFPQDFYQGCHKLLLCRLLAPPCLPPVFSPLINFLTCAHFKY